MAYPTIQEELLEEIRKLNKKVGALYNVVAFAIAAPIVAGLAIWFLASL